MKIKFLIFAPLLILAYFLSAQERKEFVIECNDFSLSSVEANNQLFYKIDMGEKYNVSTSYGQPSLPCYNEIISIDDINTVRIKETVLEKDTVYIQDGIKIFPSQKSRIKSDTSYSFYIDKAYYSVDSYGDDNYVSIRNAGMMKEENLAVLSVRLVRYNPVQNAIERIKKIKIEIDNTVPVKKAAAQVNATNINRPYKMVILTDERFKESLQPFVKWKTMQGFITETVYTSQTGTSNTEIKKYLEELYYGATKLNPPFDYLLIVGDVDIVPAFEGKYRIDNYPLHYTDLYYAEYTSDILPDVFYGRISVSDTQTLNDIIEKTVKYEKCDFVSTDYLKSSLLIAGKETGDNAPTFTNGQMNYSKQYLCTLTDTNVYYNPSSAQDSNRNAIKENLNSGNSWINYTGHGSFSGWQNPPYRTENVVSELNNIDKYGVFINNCCHAGKYDEKICFTESLLQAKGKGAVVAVGASDYTLWDEDYYWSVGSKAVSTNPEYAKNSLGMYDRFFHSHNEELSNHYITMGQAVQAGCLAVMQSLSDYSNLYWEIYNLQGDPTLIPYVGLPKQFEKILPDTLTLRTANLELTTVPYTYIAFSTEDTLLFALQSDSEGYVKIDLSDITDPKTVNVVMTNQFYKPLIDSVVFISPEESFIALKNITVTEKLSGKQAEVLTEGAEYVISFDIVNTGGQNSPANNNRIELITQDNLLVTQNSYTFSEIKSGNIQHVASAFEFKVKNGVENFATSELVFDIYQNDDFSYRQKIMKEIFAPSLSITSTVMQRLNDTLLLSVLLKNEGRKISSSGTAIIGNLSDNISVLNTVNSIKELEINQLDTVVFNLVLTDGVEKYISFDINCLTGDYETSKAYNVLLTEEFEDFENGFAVLNWQNDGENPWIIDTTVYFSGSKSARSKRNLADNKKSRLNLTVNNDVSSTISFYVKVSCEEMYDYFRFYIDNVPELSLTYGYDYNGNAMEWKQYSFNLGSGTHNLCFSYEKDQSTSFGSDCAWIDNVVLSSGSDSVIFSLVDLLQEDVVLYPNPANREINLNNLPVKSGIIITDNNARVIYRNDASKENNIIDVSFLENGIYYIIVRQKDKIFAKKKLIIAR